MRDPKRIDRICALIKKLWKKEPDWRLFQLFTNLGFDSRFRDLFFVEDKDVEKVLKEVLEHDATKE